MSEIAISKISKIGLFVIIIALFSFSQSYSGQGSLSYKGVLTDQNGVYINGTVNITLRIYNSPTGGTSLWKEVHNVQVHNGVFNVVLGDIKPLDYTLFLQEPLYIGVQIGVDSEMTPRKQITSEAYTLQTDTFGE